MVDLVAKTLGGLAEDAIFIIRYIGQAIGQRVASSEAPNCTRHLFYVSPFPFGVAMPFYGCTTIQLSPLPLMARFNAPFIFRLVFRLVLLIFSIVLLYLFCPYSTQLTTCTCLLVSINYLVACSCNFPLINFLKI